MQYVINRPFGLYRFPWPPAIKHQSKLVSAGLGILNNRAANFRFNANDLELSGKTLCEYRKRFLLVA